MVRQKNMRLGPIRGGNGHIITNNPGVANVFATFYEYLYKSRFEGPALERDNDAAPGNEPIVEPFQFDELHAALRTMKNGKAKDQAGLIAEMLKDGSTHLLKLIVEVFNDILMLRGTPPDAWKQTKLTVNFKKRRSRDAEQVPPDCHITDSL